MQPSYKEIQLVVLHLISVLASDVFFSSSSNLALARFPRNKWSWRNFIIQLVGRHCLWSNTCEYLTRSSWNHLAGGWRQRGWGKRLERGWCIRAKSASEQRSGKVPRPLRWTKNDIQTGFLCNRAAPGSVHHGESCLGANNDNKHFF